MNTITQTSGRSSGKTVEAMQLLLKKIENGSTSTVMTKDINRLKTDFETITGKKLHADYMATNIWMVRLA